MMAQRRHIAICGSATEQLPELVRSRTPILPTVELALGRRIPKTLCTYLLPARPISEDGTSLTDTSYGPPTEQLLEHKY